MSRKDIVERIDAERRAQGLSYRALAAKVGISTSNYLRWLRGGGITLEKADLALKALGISAAIGTENEKEMSLCT